MSADPLVAPLAAAVGYAIRVAAALVFTSAGAAKIGARARFRAAVFEYRILPGWMVPGVALLLPPMEVLLGLTLLLPRYIGISSVAAALLLLVFATAMAINLSRGRKTIDCGCSLSSGGQRIHSTMVIRNVSMAAALLVGAMVPFPETAVLAMTACCAGAVLFLLYVVLNRVVALSTLAMTNR